MIIKDFDLDDVFLISEIIDKMGIEADVSKITKTIQSAKLESKNDATALGKEVAVGLGIDVIAKMARNLFKAKKEVKQFICNMTGLPMEEVSKFKVAQIKDFFIELFEHEGAEDFLKQAAI